MKKILTKRDLGLTSEDEPTKFLVTDAPVLPAEYFRQTTTLQQAEPEPAMSQGNGLVEVYPVELQVLDWAAEELSEMNRIAYSNAVIAAAVELGENRDRIEADAKRIADVEAERDALKARVEWQPIETAPKDGTEIIIAESGCAGAGFYSEAPGLRSEVGWFWESDRGDLLVAKNASPTHWMPLPSPPLRASEGGADA